MLMVNLCRKSLNFIYFISFTQNAHGISVRVLKGADVGAMWSNVVEETGEPRENHHWLTKFVNNNIELISRKTSKIILW